LTFFRKEENFLIFLLCGFVFIIFLIA